MLVRDSPPGGRRMREQTNNNGGEGKKIEREKNEANLIKISKYGILSNSFVEAGFHP
jgi:hypothetical protein